MKNYIVFIIIFIIFTMCRKKNVEPFNPALGEKFLDIESIFGSSKTNFLLLNEIKDKIIEKSNIKTMTESLSNENKNIIMNAINLFFIGTFGFLTKAMQTECKNKLVKPECNMYKVNVCNQQLINDKSCDICKPLDIEDQFIKMYPNEPNMLFSFFNVGLSDDEIGYFKKFYINADSSAPRKNIIDGNNLITYEFNGNKRYSLNPFTYASNVMMKGKGTYLIKGLVFIFRLMIELNWNIYDDTDDIKILIAVLCLPALRWRELSKKKIPNEKRREERRKILINDFVKKLGLTDNETVWKKTIEGKKYTEKKLFTKVANYLLRQDFFSFSVLYIDEKLFNPITLYLMTKQIKRNSSDSYTFCDDVVELNKTINAFSIPDQPISAFEIIMERVRKKLNNQRLGVYRSKVNDNDELLSNVDIRDIEITLTSVVSQESKKQSELIGQMSFLGIDINHFKPQDGKLNVIKNGIISKNNMEQLKSLRVIALIKLMHEEIKFLGLKNYKKIDYQNLTIVGWYNEFVHISLGEKESLKNFKEICNVAIKNMDILIKYAPDFMNNKSLYGL